MNLRKVKKKWITIGLISVLLLGGGVWAYRHFTAKPAAATPITAAVKRGDVRKVISATGTVNYPKAIPLSFQQAGKVVAVNVKVGDQVKQGQVLAQLDTNDLALSVAQSRANLASAQAKYQQVLDNAKSVALDALANAQRAFADAQKALIAAQQNADPSYLANQVYLAQQTLKADSDNLAAAQQSGNAGAIANAQAKLNQDQAALTSALNAQNGGAAADLAKAQAAYNSAQADLAIAQAQYDKYQQGVPSTDILGAQASLAQAQVSLANAQSNFNNATLVAPVDGTITTVSIQSYQNVGASTQVMTLAAGNNILQVDVAVDQADISQVKVGQKADITIDSAPDQHVGGTVSQVALQGTTTQNVTTFAVTVQLDQPTALLRAGMNANVSIIEEEVQNVLTVPSEAIQTRGGRTGVLVPGAPSGGSNAGTDRSNWSAGQGHDSSGQGYQRSSGQGSGSGAGQGSSYGNGSSQQNGAGNRSFAGAAALNNLNVHYVPVEIGLDDGTNVEIKSGLAEGQQVIIGFRSPSTSATGQSGFRLGGGGGDNPMGALRNATRSSGGGNANRSTQTVPRN